MYAFLLGTAITLVSIAISLGGLYFVRKKFSTEELKADHDVAAALISILGTLYAIVLGLVVVDALAHREQAELNESIEGNSLATVMHMVRPLPVEKRRPILLAELNYVELTLGKEWDLLDHGDPPDKDTTKAFGDLWVKTSAFEPETNRETNLHSSMLATMVEMSNARRYRIVTCKHGLPSLLWVILIVGGFCTVGFTYFFAASKGKSQAIMTAIVTLVLSLNVLLVYFYGSPYKGDLAIDPHSLIHARDLLRRAPVLEGYIKPPGMLQSDSAAEKQSEAPAPAAPPSGDQSPSAPHDPGDGDQPSKADGSDEKE